MKKGWGTLPALFSLLESCDVYSKALVSVAAKKFAEEDTGFTLGNGDPRITSSEKAEVGAFMGLLSVLQTPPHLSACFRAQEESTGLLSSLRIWHTQLLPGGLQGLILNPIFRQNLRIALLGGYVTSTASSAGPGDCTSGWGAVTALSGSLWALPLGAPLGMSWTRYSCTV